jgi:hypothetical protein
MLAEKTSTVRVHTNPSVSLEKFELLAQGNIQNNICSRGPCRTVTGDKACQSQGRQALTTPGKPYVLSGLPEIVLLMV